MNRNEYLSKINIYAYPLCTRFVRLYPDRKRERKKKTLVSVLWLCQSLLFLFLILFHLRFCRQRPKYHSNDISFVLFILFLSPSLSRVADKIENWLKKERRSEIIISHVVTMFLHIFCFYLFYDFYFYLLCRIHLRTMCVCIFFIFFCIEVEKLSWRKEKKCFKKHSI